MNSWIHISTFTVLFLVRIVSSRNVLEYFHLDSMLNYDIFIYSDLPRKQIEDIQKIALGSGFALAVQNLEAWVKTSIGFSYRPTRNVIAMISPANKSEFYFYGNEIFPTSEEFTGESAHQPHIFLAWPEVMESESDISSVMETLYTTFNFTLNANVFIIFRIDADDRGMFSVWEIYSIKGERFTQGIGLFTEIRIINIFAKSTRRQNFNGVVISAVASAAEGYWFESSFSNDTGTLVLNGGLAANLYWDLRDMLNFSESSKDGGGWMYIENNTLQGGQATALLEGTADICISQNCNCFLQGTFAASSVNLVNIYNQPFDTYVWITLFILTLAFPGLINLFVAFTTLNKKSIGNQVEFDKHIEQDSIMWVIGTITQQGWHVFPSGLSLRILFITGAFSAVVVYNAFSAVLVSKLSVQLSPIQSLKDLILYDYAFIYYRNSVSLREFTKGMKSYYKIPKIEAYSYNEISSQAMKPKSVALSYWENIEGIFPVANNSEYICESLQAFPIENTIVHMGMTVKKGSPFEEVFNQKIIQLKERGFNQRYACHYSWATEPQCLERNTVRHDPLELQSLFSAHLLLIAGLFGAFIGFILELYIFNRQTKLMVGVFTLLYKYVP